MALAAPPLGDEAYYWRWGQDLDWSYHDHPPLNALLLRLSYELFGWNLFALRAPGLLSFAVAAWIVAWWGRRLASRHEIRPAATAVALLLASPLMLVFTTLAFPDHLLIACGMAAVHFFVLYAGGVEAGAARPSRLILAALLVGLAALAKYSAVFVGLGFAFWFLFAPAGRGELRTPWPWAAGLLALALQAPVAWWNWQHQLSSFRFHFGERFMSAAGLADAGGRLAVFLLFAGLMLSPFLLPALWRFLRGNLSGEAARFAAIGRPAFAAGIAVFGGLSVVIIPYFYWVVPLLLPFMPVAAALSRRWLGPCLAYGVTAAAALAFHLTVMPLTSLAGIKAAEDISFGWTGIAAAVDREAERHGAPLLLASQYNLAALLGFHMQRRDVYSVTVRPEQYDYWFDPAQHAGKDAIVITDAERPPEPQLVGLFETFEEIGTVTSSRFGVPIHTFTLHVGRRLRAD